MYRKPEEIMRARMHYGMGGLCEMCGGATDGLSLKCERCLTALYLTEELKYAGDWLREHPGALVECAHDKKKKVHLALFRAPSISWCGATVTQARKDRKQVNAGQFPAGLCEQCVLVYEGIVP